MSICTAPSCTRQAVGYGKYCNSHKARDRRHGHPQQQTITVTRLKHHIETARHFINRHPERDAWIKLERLWQSIVADAEGVLRAYESGEPQFSWHVAACRDLLKVAQDTEPRRIVETVVGFGLLWKREPGAFRSDRAAWIGLSRRFRALTYRNAGSYWNSKVGRVTRVYRDASPKAGEWLGKHLMTHLGLAGSRIADLMERAAAARQTAMTDALLAM